MSGCSTSQGGHLGRGALVDSEDLIAEIDAGSSERQRDPTNHGWWGLWFWQRIGS